MRRILLATVLLLASAAAPRAEPVPYVLEPAESRVEFVYTANGSENTGTMPILRADIALDLDRIANSSARVTLDAAGARTGIPPVTQALKSDSVLDTDTHPTITFVSRSVARRGDGARIEGDVTLRGVTRPLTLDARVYRRRGSEPGDLSRLTVLLTGALDRSAFGAGGFAGMVADEVRLRIIARLRRAE